MARDVKFATPVQTSIDFTTLALVTREMQFVDAAEDPFINGLIDEVRDDINRMTGRRWQKETVTEKIQAPVATQLLLTVRPVLSITSVVLNGTTVVNTDYSIQSAGSGLIYNERGWGGDRIEGAVDSFSLTPNRIAVRGPIFDLTVIYVAGFDMHPEATPNFPKGLQNVANMAVRHLFMNRRNDPLVQEHRHAKVSDSYVDISYDTWLSQALRGFVEKAKLL